MMIFITKISLATILSKCSGYLVARQLNPTEITNVRRRPPLHILCAFVVVRGRGQSQPVVCTAGFSTICSRTQRTN